MSSSITSSDLHLPMSKKRLKPLILRDYLLDDLSSCSSNGFKSFPRRQTSSTVRHLLNAEIKRSGMFRFHHSRRLTCGLTLSHAVQKASTALLNAVKLLPFPSSVKPPSPSDNKKRVFSRSFSTRFLTRSFWKKPYRRDREEEENQRLRSFGDFLQESPSDRIFSFSGEATLSNAAGESSSFRSELFTNSEVTQSSSGESETWNQNDAVETSNGVVVMMSGDCVGSHVSDGSSVNDNKEVS